MYEHQEEFFVWVHCMTFSILYPQPQPTEAQAAEEPAFFHDLNLDQVVDAVTSSRNEYGLKHLFYALARDLPTVAFRQQVVRDLLQDNLRQSVQAFAKTMQVMRERLALAGSMRAAYQRQRWFVDAVTHYCNAVDTLTKELNDRGPTSAGLQRCRDYLTEYGTSAEYGALREDSKRLLSDLAAVRYTVLIRNDIVTVEKYGDQPDYGATINSAFTRFGGSPKDDYRFDFQEVPQLNQVEERILGIVAKAFPNVFARLETYFQQRQTYLDSTISRFDREVQFYLAYLEYIEPLKAAGLQFSLPEIGIDSTECSIKRLFDIALAASGSISRESIVSNDIELRAEERIIVVTGPNQGGKTTFARAIAQAHYLAALGLPVQGSAARLRLCDSIFTHFERGEPTLDGHGKLEDDLIRAHEIVQGATGNSLILFNEIFTSTTLSDARTLSQELLRQVRSRRSLCVWVTFIDELAAGSNTVSMVALVDPANPTRRTYQIARQPASGTAFAITLAQKYGLTGRQVSERLKS